MHFVRRSDTPIYTSEVGTVIKKNKVSRDVVSVAGLRLEWSGTVMCIRHSVNAMHGPIQALHHEHSFMSDGIH